MPFIYSIAIYLSVALPYGNNIMQEPSVARIMFYNAENLFDVSDNPGTDDGEFTPGGNMHWTTGRYYKKLNNLSKVFIAAGNWQPPDIIGLCEIENRHVLNDLVYNTPFSKFEYRFIHADCRDRRGIDVAILYNPQRVCILKSHYLRIDTSIVTTRDILFATLKMARDTFHLFVNHWPSRSSGQLETEKGRMAAAQLVKHVTDSLFLVNNDCNIVIMGDLNDEPNDESIISGLQIAIPTPTGYPHPDGVGKLYNLTAVPPKGAVKGTLKYQGNWNIFDQIIVSGAMISNKIVSNDGYRICVNPFLLEQDDAYNGVKPFRTYTGFKYTGGFSDHLPVFLDVYLRQ